MVLPETQEILRTKAIFQEHSPTLSVSSEPRNNESFSDNTKFTCDECDNKHETCDDLEDHSHFKCEVCNRLFDQDILFQKHSHVRHNILLRPFLV